MQEGTARLGRVTFPVGARPGSSTSTQRRFEAIAVHNGVRPRRCCAHATRVVPARAHGTAPPPAFMGTGIARPERRDRASPHRRRCDVPAGRVGPVSRRAGTWRSSNSSCTSASTRTSARLWC